MSRPSAAPDPRCPARLVGIVHDAAAGAPIAGATVVVETARGRVAAERTDARGRFETAAVRPPARLRIYHGEHAVEHPLASCQPPLRIGVRLAP
ncbi:MAG TPA: carboxypeptidase regulatory-like domain-containing protein [Kofleriaceae bacterium]|nr:carboxypeptidase regulatory-like domain-containing protein [Kofleriaceae bacterium]